MTADSIISQRLLTEAPSTMYGKELLLILVLAIAVNAAVTEQEPEERDVLDLETRGWMSWLGGILGLEDGCEKQEFKKVLKMSIAKMKKYIPGLDKLLKKLQKEKGAESREIWARASLTEEEARELDARGWQSTVSDLLGFNACQKSVFKKIAHKFTAIIKGGMKLAGLGR